MLRVYDLAPELVFKQVSVLPLSEAEDIEANSVAVEEVPTLAQAQVFAGVVKLEVLVACAEASL